MFDQFRVSNNLGLIMFRLTATSINRKGGQKTACLMGVGLAGAGREDGDTGRASFAQRKLFRLGVAKAALHYEGPARGP